jgi:A/G-specific adenine glycosylase
MGTTLVPPLAATESVVELRSRLLAWYERNRRDLPWRRTRDPYAIWVSEIMLQQTRVAAVVERYEAFLRNFPTVGSLGRAGEADVLALWSGLGYYRRARMLHRAAQVVVAEFGGVIPGTAAGLRELPGIGAYTSAAIASIAYGEPVAVVDGNVERVIQRLAGWGSDTSGGQAKLMRETAQMAQALLDPARPGDFNQAMMELGATVCLPRNPQCLTCPVYAHCQTRGEHPTVKRARMRSEDAGYALVIQDREAGSQELPEVLLVQRSQHETVMPGLWELPALRESVIPEARLRLRVRHSIMQVNYNVGIRVVLQEDIAALTVPFAVCRWVRVCDLEGLALTGLARKVLLRSKLPELAPCFGA